MTPQSTIPQGQLLVRAGVVLALVVLGAALAADPALRSELQGVLNDVRGNPRAVVGILVLYMALIALPFVPGVEIGLFLLAVFGAAMALPVYLATVAALMLSFSLGALASKGAPWRRWDGPGPARIDAGTLMASRADGWAGRILRYRWLALVVLINMPGNTVLGGGGGIAMAAGYSRAFAYPAFLACIAVAVAPVPLAVLIADHFDAGEMVRRWLQLVPAVSPDRAGPARVGL